MLNASILKWIALMAMVIDHFGLIFYDKIPFNVYLQLRIIGRLSFPIFAFLLVQGFIYTKNKQAFLLRLFVFAIGISSAITISSLLFNFESLPQQNVLYTLGLGFLGMWLLEIFGKEYKLLTFLGIIAIALIGDFIRVDYGAYGILTVILFYLFRKNEFLALGSFVVFTIIQCALDFWYIQDSTFIQLYAIFAVFLLALYDGNKGTFNHKYFFYWFYPLHFLILYVVKLLLFN